MLRTLLRKHALPSLASSRAAPSLKRVTTLLLWVLFLAFLPLVSGSRPAAGEFKTRRRISSLFGGGGGKPRQPSSPRPLGVVTTLLVPDGARKMADALTPVTGSLKSTVNAWFSDKAATEATYGAIADWDTSGVTSCSTAFFDRGDFNEDVSRWNMAGVTDMYAMFYKAIAFNGDVSAWNVQAVTSMMWMFGNTDSFNGDVSAWNVQAVTNMGWMFYGATSFKIGRAHV